MFIAHFMKQTQSALQQKQEPQMTFIHLHGSAVCFGDISCPLSFVMKLEGTRAHIHCLQEALWVILSNPVMVSGKSHYFKIYFCGTECCLVSSYLRGG